MKSAINYILEISANFLEKIDEKLIENIGQNSTNIAGIKFLHATRLGSESFLKICRLFPDIRILDISSCTELKDQDFKNILELTTNLAELDISKNQINGLILPSSCSHLQKLNISYCRNLESLDFEENFDHSNLKYLNLHDLKKLDAAKIVAIIQKLPSLTSLDVGACNLEDSDLQSIILAAQNVKQLTISDLRITKLNLESARLEIVDLSECDALQTLSLNTTNLIKLDLSVCIAITELEVTSNLDQLTHLSLKNTQELPASEIIKLLKLTPNLEEIDITGSKESKSILDWIKESKHFTKILHVEDGNITHEIKKQMEEPSKMPTNSTVTGNVQKK
jgi:uncharacterized protein YjbI with pentapeptide repeats